MSAARGFELAALACLAGFAVCAAAQDYAREKRWAGEVIPNVVVGDAVQLELAPGRQFLGLYTETTTARPAVLLVHGAGVHPDHGVIGALRVALAERGHATLSIQMPVLQSGAPHEDYAAVFPEAFERIGVGARWLEHRGHRRPVLLSHSMGSLMSQAYYEQRRDAPFAAWVCLGLSGNFTAPGNVNAPVLDLYGENDFAAVLRAGALRRRALASIPGSRQAMIAGADHYFTGREKELAAEIGAFIARLAAR